MTIISADGTTALSKGVAGNVAQGMQLGSDLTGVDIAGLLNRLAARGKEPSAAPDKISIDTEEGRRP